MTRVYDTLPVFAQNWSCTAAGYARFRSRFGSHFRRILREWEESVRWPAERLFDLQRRRLDGLIRHARQHVPYYRDLSEPSPAADPAHAIRETLAGIPPLEKWVYRDQPEAFLARDLPRSNLVSGYTSGTTGSALPLWCTPETLAEEYASVWRMRRSCGVASPREPNMTFNGSMIVPFDQSEPPFWRTSAYDRRTLFSVYHMTPENLRTYVDAVHSVPARYVEGYPSAIHLIARVMLEAGRPLPQGRVAAVFTSSESLLAFQRHAIEKAFNAPVRDRYGVSEKSVSMTECERGFLHVDMEFGIVEVEGETELDGSVTGPLVVTGLAGNATPMLRYRIGDVGTRTGKPCACGRLGDVFQHVDGRIEDYVLTPDGRLIGRLDHIFKQQYQVAEAQILQETRDAIDILLVPRDGYTETSAALLLKEARARLGSEIGIRIHTVDHIAREPNGKFRAVKSKVGTIHDSRI
jgi:phenylacetate-coenzyme A ligase PaaK-like adenylate-forming protein